MNRLAGGRRELPARRRVARTGLLLSLAAAALAAPTVLAACGGSGAPRPDLLFVSTRSGVNAIYEMNADGSRQRRLTSGGPSDASSPSRLLYETTPAWSPDGRRIAFASSRYGSSDIFVMDASGEHVRRLTSTRDDDTHPTWSPDGRRIAFVRGGHGAIFVMNADGSHVRRLTGDTARQDDPAWSPDGRWIAYARNTPLTTSTEIWLVHPDGADAHALTSLNAATTWPAWSPDSREIAFSSAVGELRYSIYVVRVGTRKARRLTRSNDDEFEPAWSPDGRRIAFVRDGSIVTVAADGSDERVLTDPKDNDSSPAWNPRLPAAATK
ncbi:MAG TPA: hypothetical protein VFA44_11900 [Gaiellaceae bacterium]|nr:hypothetical protein [Gaiellaceae bacterium]